MIKMAGLISRLVSTSAVSRIASPSPRAAPAIVEGWSKAKRGHPVGLHRIATRPLTMNSQTNVRCSVQTCRRYIGTLARPPIQNGVASHTMTNMSPRVGLSVSDAGKVAPLMQFGRYSSVSHKTDTQSQNDIPYPDTLEEHEYGAFNEWSNNCIEFCLPGCVEQIHHLTAGDKSMSQVFAEQRQLIESIANNYKLYGLDLPPGDTTFCPFTAQGIQEGFGGVEVQPVHSRPCPEGVQDLDCHGLEQYLELCRHYRFTDCEEQLKKLHCGKKSITELLEDREKVLQDLVHYYDANVSKASDDSMGSTHEQGHDGATELSQMQRFKQMVKEYGTVVVVFHICISLISLGICYTLVSRLIYYLDINQLEQAYKKLLIFQLCVGLMAVHSFMQRPVHPSFGQVEIWMDSGVDLVSLITKLNLLPADFNTKVVAGASTFVIAYAFHKMFVPVRMGITLASAPLIVRYLRRIGFLKAPKPK